MKNIDTVAKNNIICGNFKLTTSKMFNINYGLSSLNNVFCNIMNIINTNAYLNNEQPYSNSNPYYTSKTYLRYGPTMNRSSIGTI